ncbi:helix-turn-helix transcriptional regulator [Clostridium kluyveri]|uniref:helix-turn-helix transcriptional regulator n=1 Tax=Clostridium kluyveri TaxID=1534 RepID=UPI00224655ED|nr:helix-turn-helix transcriptional regulator [Clostridium kluyveri]UZQ51625.1 helix-turn-helix transcriptional regulator [Clostridium kluyveri]
MKHLKKLRQKAGYKTVKEVVPFLQVTRSMVYQMEEGYKRPSPELGARMAKLYNCSLDDIFLPIITTNSDNITTISD